jgi:VWFA-related protein
MRFRISVLIAGLGFAAALAAQPRGSGRLAAETSMRNEAATFRTHVNLVTVPVVVRDKSGKAIGDLTKQDFQLFDKGRPQEITQFSVEKIGGKPSGVKPEATPGQAPGEPGQAIAPPDHFIAYLFDDVHIAFTDIARVRDAASRHIDSLGPQDRAGIYTTSGQAVQEFTGDREKLHEALGRLMPRPIARSIGKECPDISYYMADLIENKRDPGALQAALADAAVNCKIGGPAAETLVHAEAQRRLTFGKQETEASLNALRELVRRMAEAPGSRTILLLSPGFFTPEQQAQKTDIFDRAIRANVIVSTLNSRGLWTDGSFDASQGNPKADQQSAMRLWFMLDRQNAYAGAGVLSEIAESTGGAAFQDNNDYDEGIRRLATPPEYIYHLGFAPQNLKLDGSFHVLKVALHGARVPGLELVAHRGYYAPSASENQEENARREIEEAVSSREEMQEIPARLRTQYSKTNDKRAKLTVLVHIEIKQLRYRKDGGHNCDDLTVVATLFDAKGNYVKGITKVIEFRLKDDTVQKRLGPGLDAQTTFDVEPGAYRVRLVIRDSEGHMMSAANSDVNVSI